MFNRFYLTKVTAVIPVGVFLALSIALAACGGSPPPAATSAAAPPVASLDTSYSNALSVRNQLLLGAIRLQEGSGPTLTQEQAARLLPLWRAAKALVVSGTSSQAEQDAITNQILAAMTAEQIQAIQSMRLALADMQAFNQSVGVTAPAAGSSGLPGGTPGFGQSTSPEQRATRQAEMGKTGGNTAVLDYLINLLERQAKE
jgi:hypothetical protein